MSIGVGARFTTPMATASRRRYPSNLFLAFCLTGAAVVATADLPAAPASIQSRQGSPGPGEPFLAVDGEAAILLQDADLYAQPSADSDVIARVPAGTVLEFSGESADAFGRTWAAVRDPDHVQRRRDIFLAPFTFAQFRRWGGVGVLLADRIVAAGPQLAPVPDAEPFPWWTPETLLVGGQAPDYQETVGISGRRVDRAHLEQAIELLGGRPALADWPSSPDPGQLFVPQALPVLYEWNGERWRPVEPVVFLQPSLSLMPNTLLRIDRQAAPLVGGPVLPCWDFVGALSPARQEVGTIAAARPFVPTAPTGVPQRRSLIQEMLAPTTLNVLVPPRVDPAPLITGVLISDNDGKQAAYLEQALSEDSTRRLRGRQMVLDVWARAPPSASPATFGVDVEVRTAADVPGEYFSTSFSVGTEPTYVAWPFTVSEQAVVVIVRLLPVDKSVAVEQRGMVIIDRVALRLAGWNPEPPSAVFPLHKVSVLTYEGRPLYTRAAVAVSQRSAQELRELWPAVAAADWPEEDKRMILAGQLRHGMVPEQVRLSWGEPEEQLELGIPPGSIRSWIYDDRQATFDGDVLLGFLVPSDDEAVAPPSLCGLPTIGERKPETGADRVAGPIASPAQ